MTGHYDLLIPLRISFGVAIYHNGNDTPRIYPALHACPTRFPQRASLILYSRELTQEYN
jgi:hypothetical protein